MGTGTDVDDLDWRSQCTLPRTQESHPLRSGFLTIIPAASYSPGQFPTKYHRR